MKCGKYQHLCESVSRSSAFLPFPSTITTSPPDASDLCFGPIIKNLKYLGQTFSLAKGEIRGEKNNSERKRKYTFHYCPLFVERLKAQTPPDATDTADEKGGWLLC